MRGRRSGCRIPPHPGPLPEERERFWPSDQKRDLLRVQRFARIQCAVRIAANTADEIAEFAFDDHASHGFVRQSEGRQIVFVEEMPKRAVADIVQQAGQPQQTFDVTPAGHIGANLFQTVVQRRRSSAGQVHDAQYVLKPGVFGRGENPPRGLQLMDLPQPLQPRMIDDLPLGNFASRESLVRHQRHVTMQRIVTQGFTAKVGHRGGFRVQESDSVLAAFACDALLCN